MSESLRDEGIHFKESQKSNQHLIVLQVWTWKKAKKLNYKICIRLRCRVWGLN